jgi:hypothetical protein
MQRSNVTHWTWFVRAVSLCYQEPAIVVKRMERFSQTKGQNAFLKKLATEPAFFGKRLSAPLNDREPEALERRREARHASALLPLLAKDALDPVITAGHSQRRARAR